MISSVLKVAAVVVLVGFAAPSAFANEPVERTNTTTLWFESWGKLSNATLTVVSPDGQHIDIFNASSSPTFQLHDLEPVVDGIYNYELTAATDEMVTLKNQLDNGRGAAQKTEVPKSFHMNGHFFVSRGVIAEKEKLVEE